MNRFNLTFRGEIVEGHDPEQVRDRLAQLLTIDDPVVLQRCFSGDPVVLRRNLERKEAAELYARLRRLGVHVDLVKIGERGDLHAGETDSLLASPKTEAPSSPTPDDAIAPAPDTSGNAGRKWPTAPAGSAAKNSITSGKLKESEAHKAIRRADLAASKELQAEHNAELKSREKALKKALLSKEKEKARHTKAIDKAQKKTLSREAKHKARLAAAKRKAELQQEQADEAAKRTQALKIEQAEQARLQAIAREAQERREAEESERMAAERAEKARLEQARQEEKRRLAAKKTAQKAKEKRKAQEVAARLQVENARRKREQADEAARRRAEEVLRKAEEEEQQRALEEDQQAQRRAMEEQAIQRAATELAHKPGLKQVHARVKTRLETPSMQRRSGAQTVATKRKKQAGAPNIYSLTPFRNTPGIRDRATLSKQAMRHAYTAAAIALVAALILAVRLATLPANSQLDGPTGMAIAPQGRLLLIAGQHLFLHDRSGVSISELPFASLGVSDLRPPLAFDGTGKLLAVGELNTDTTPPGPDSGPLLRCDLNANTCEDFASELSGSNVSALAVHPIDGSIFVTDSTRGELLQLSAEGSVIARASIALPAQPALHLDSGLLLINSTMGPGISVYRYEADAFGTQLDEILLLPDDDSSGEFSGVADFVRNGEYWWAIMQSATQPNLQLARFDSRWQFVDRPKLAQGSHPAQLVSWATRTLVRDPARTAIQRFSSSGVPEVPLVSKGLSKQLGEQEHRANLVQLGWRIGLALTLLAAAAGLCLGGLHRVRSLVYTSCRERGAAPVDELADDIDWVDLAPDRDANFRRTGLGYLALATGLVMGAIGLGASSIQLAGVLLALTGPAIALLLLQRSDTGHIGVSSDQLLLVDHTGMYHFGGGARIHHRGPFVMIDDVIVFTGTLLLPAFSPAAIQAQVRPVVVGGITVDRKIVTVKLVQARHPLALGAMVILATSASAIALLSLHGIF